MKHFSALFFFCFLSFVNFSSASAEALKVGICAELPPFQYVSSTGIAGQYDGFDIALIKAAAEDLGMELELEAMPFDSLIMALKTEKVDAVISNMAVTKERSRAVNFSIPYFIDKQVMLVLKDSSITTAMDMRDKKIGVLSGSIGEIAVKKLGFPYESFNASPEGVVELKNGKCDVFVIDNVVARRFCSTMDGIKIVEDNKVFNAVNVGIAVNKKNTQLLKKINASIKKLQENGAMNVFLRKYIY